MSRNKTNGKKTRTGNPPSNISITKKNTDQRNLDSTNIFGALESSPRTPEPWKFEFPGNNVAPKVQILEKAMKENPQKPKGRVTEPENKESKIIETKDPNTNPEETVGSEAKPTEKPEAETAMENSEAEDVTPEDVATAKPDPETTKILEKSVKIKLL